MPAAPLEDAVQYWIRSLNAILGHPELQSFCLQAYRSPNDSGNEHDPSITRASIHIGVGRANTAPAMIGLVTMSEVRDSEDDSEILGQDVCEDQVRCFRSAGPLICFVANHTTRLTFYECLYVDDGAATQSGQLPWAIEGANMPSFSSAEIEQDRRWKRVFADAIMANLKQARNYATRVLL